MEVYFKKNATPLSTSINYIGTILSEAIFFYIY